MALGYYLESFNCILFFNSSNLNGFNSYTNLKEKYKIDRELEYLQQNLGLALFSICGELNYKIHAPIASSQAFHKI